MSPDQKRVLLLLREELAEAGCELSGAELNSLGQFLMLLDAAGSSDGLQRILDRLAPTWRGHGCYSLLDSRVAAEHHEFSVR